MTPTWRKRGEIEKETRRKGEKEKRRKGEVAYSKADAI